MSEFKHLERIDAYLEGKMGDSERKSFELELEEDEVLREEFDACQAAQKTVSFMAFRGMIERIKQEPHPMPLRKSKGMNEKRLLFWAIAALVIAVLIWMFYPSEKTKVPTTPQTVPSDSIQPQKLSLPTPTDTQSSKKNNPTNVQKQNDAPTTKQKERHIAQKDPADFAPNASGEAYLSLRSGGLEVEITSPLNDADFAPKKSGETLIRFAGTISGNPNMATAGNSIAIYDNKNVNKPLVSIPLVLKKDAAGTMSFDEQQRLKYPAGLYYFRIKSPDGEMIYAGKFTIGKNGK